MPDDRFEPDLEGEGAAGRRGVPICACGVTAIPAESASTDPPRFVCENPDCEAFGSELI